jgi:hypothetical protein
VLEEIRPGGSSDSDLVSTDAPVTGASDHLYLVAIAPKPSASVLGVSGLGLSWTPVRAQCAGRAQTGVEVWQAMGTPGGDGIVTAILASTVPNAAMTVTRYSGVDAANPVGSVTSVNTNGTEGACAGGSDTNSYATDLATTVDGSVTYVAAAMRNRLHTPGDGYAENIEVRQGSGGGIASVAVADQTIEVTSVVTVDGSFNGSVDWAVVAAELMPAIVPVCTSDAHCDDGLLCNGQETCDPSGQCQPGATPTCDDGIGCTIDSCNPGTDSCENLADDTRCDNGLYCDGIESCDAALDCQAGTAVICDDGVNCTVDSCDESTDGCEIAADDGRCDDGLFCNGPELCVAGQGCTIGIDPCPGQLCAEDADSCAACLDDGDCDDGDACTSDTCGATNSCQYAAVECGDGDACTIDSCDAATGCANEHIDCNDGDACTTDTCDSAAGCANAPVDCNDGDACTTDSCDAANGCAYDPVDCNDGDACTTDSCDAASGCATDPIDCNDSNACTIDTCDAASGCAYDLVGCDDSNACTTDSCDTVIGCQNDAVDCNDGDACTTDACDAVNGCEYDIVDCDDSSLCTNDSCDAVSGCANDALQRR